MTTDTTTEHTNSPEEDVQALRARLAEVEAERDEARRNAEYLAERLARREDMHRTDIALIGETLIAEATTRGWCGEYDEFVEDLNGRLNIGLPTRAHNVHISFTVEVRGELTQDAVDDAAIDYIRTYLGCSEWEVVS